ncbi:hypothetical protein HBH70_126300 [Parastagonospora nodorum]|nr:hypothetical protein HBH43_185720 [Parastagonospora nodorum]KAH5075817.1 hypothetical protein HBH95_126790 [Parastagonospora nodorum]KAH5136023.1 hypothetical protein HBH70_126300 [Parastagonospora nodorum]KAH5734495.1 hypothetical protein HBI20_027550 [Parastagonospora nodorum]KAH6210488.1 hypothetical protein HBI43_162240 [Parastagonospora nodorum]
MGSVLQEIWPQVIADTQLIVEDTKVPLSTTYYNFKPVKIDGPLVDINLGININGDGDDSHKTFALKQKCTGWMCKTALKPCDEAITAILLRTWHLAGPAVEVL